MRAICKIPNCIALASDGSEFCAVHRWHANMEALMEDRPQGLQPVTDRIEYDADGKPVRFYPRTR